MDAKKALIVAGVALVLFYAVTQPAQAATAVTTLLGWLKDGVQTILGWLGLGVPS